MFKPLIFSALFAWTGVVLGDSPSSYAGQQHREIKALSPNDVQNYLEGKGMGFAKAAELNRYPGPLHVLADADKLDLTPEQKDTTRRIFSAMQQEAKRLGKTMVEKERELDRLFATRAIDAPKLRSLLDDIGRLYAQIRNVHLQAHLDQAAVLTSAQVTVYDKLRGYTKTSPSTDEHSHSP